MDIYVWGTGCSLSGLVGKQLDPARITAFVDTYAVENGLETFLDRPVITPNSLVGCQDALVLVASRHTGEIRAQCHALGLDTSRLFFLYNNYSFNDLNANYELVQGVLPDTYLALVKNRYRVIRTDGGFSDDGQIEVRDMEDDYIRLRTLQLTAEALEHGGVRGAAAELGVYKGRFATYINRVLPDRKLYLFDTFEGFELTEALAEKAAEHCGDAFIEAHKNTAAEKVLARMPNKENVVLVQGLFPESLRGLDETFAFVSIDVDFEASINSGLTYFYPRLAEGGYIFIHDYNSPELTGVKKAVGRYEADHSIRLCKVPICDIGGTLVITK